MVNGTLQVVTSILPNIFGFIYMMALFKMGKLQKTLEEMAPDLKPVLTPSQEAATKSNAARSKIIGGIFGLGFMVVLILNTAAPDLMAWGRVPVDPDSTLYTDLQVAGLITLGVAWFVEIFCMKSFAVRSEYLQNYFANPKNSRPPRSVEDEYFLLKRFPYNLWREPLAMSFHWMSVSAVLLTQSWFLLIIQAIVVLLNEMTLIQNDVKWRSWFLREAYDRYFDETGGQWSCGCLNSCNKAVLRMRDEKYAKLAAFDGDGAVTGKVRLSSSYDQKEQHVTIDVQRSSPYTN